MFIVKTYLEGEGIHAFEQSIYVIRIQAGFVFPASNRNEQIYSTREAAFAFARELADADARSIRIVYLP